MASRINATGEGGRADLSDLGADDNYISPFFSLRWRPFPRWRWDFSYQNLKLDGLREATSQINFDDITMPVGWNVRSELTIHLYSATVGYAFYRAPNAELGGLVGLHVLTPAPTLKVPFCERNPTLSSSAVRACLLPPVSVRFCLFRHSGCSEHTPLTASSLWKEKRNICRQAPLIIRAMF